jgi:hypothetical protein
MAYAHALGVERFWLADQLSGAALKDEQDERAVGTPPSPLMRLRGG